MGSFQVGCLIETSSPGPPITNCAPVQLHPTFHPAAAATRFVNSPTAALHIYHFFLLTHAVLVEASRPTCSVDVRPPSSCFLSLSHSTILGIARLLDACTYACTDDLVVDSLCLASSNQIQSSALRFEPCSTFGYQRRDDDLHDHDFTTLDAINEARLASTCDSEDQSNHQPAARVRESFIFRHCNILYRPV